MPSLTVNMPWDNAEKTHCIHGHEFTPENTYRIGPHKQWRRCKTCHSAQYRIAPEDRKRKNRPPYLDAAPQRIVRARNLWKNYKLLLEHYDEMLTQQNGTCSICKGEPNGVGKENGIYHVDHDPATGNIRGLLCGNCNHGLGKFQHSPEHLRAAADYLEEGYWEFA